MGTCIESFYLPYAIIKLKQINICIFIQNFENPCQDNFRGVVLQEQQHQQPTENTKHQRNIYIYIKKKPEQIHLKHSEHERSTHQ